MDFMVLFCKNSVKCVHQMPGTLLLLATEHTLTVKKIYAYPCKIF